MMANLTYKDLYRLVIEEIERRSVYGTTKKGKDQFYSGTLQYANPISGGTFGDNEEILESITKLLGEVVPNWIKEGLIVKATQPESPYIVVEKGIGICNGKVYRLEEDVTLLVPFDRESEVYFVNLFVDMVSIEKTQSPDKLTIAKIIVPNPKGRYLVYDTPYLDYPYIINYREVKLYQDGYGRLEEDSLEFLRNNMTELLADNLIGNIRLSEDLKIINSQGSLEIDGKEIRILNTEGKLLAKFNKKGIFFFNQEGQNLAKFSTDEAVLGNIVINPDSIQSKNFASGFSGEGFRITSEGNAEFYNVLVRGEIKSAIFTANETHVTNGDLYVTSSSFLTEDINDSQDVIKVKEAVFNDGDILLINKAGQKEYMKVLSGGGTTELTVERGFSGSTPKNWKRDDIVVALKSRVNIISSGDLSENLPYLDVIERYGNDNVNQEAVRVRIGNLNGIGDANFGSLSGWGIYTNHGYFSNVAIAGGVDISPISPGLYLTGCYLGFYNGVEWRSYIDCNGNFDFKGQDGQCICYDGTNLCIFGKISADSIDTGTIDLSKNITIASDGCTTIFNSSGIFSYDQNNCLKFSVIDGHIVASDIKLVDPSCECCYSYLDGGALVFHNELGDIPYVKRLESGTASNGETVCLIGWKDEPKIMVGIKSLTTYNCGYDFANQFICVFYTAPEFWCNSSIDYGYCFKVYADLYLSSIQAPECIRDVNFGVPVTLHDGTISSVLRFKFQLWANAEPPSYYCYGDLWFDVCYRKYGASTWCACSFHYVQPHGSISELQTTYDHCVCMFFPEPACWEVMACQKTLNWCLTSLEAGSTTEKVCTIYASDLRIDRNFNAQFCGCGNGLYCTICVDTVNFSGFPSNVYCAEVYWKEKCITGYNMLRIGECFCYYYAYSSTGTSNCFCCTYSKFVNPNGVTHYLCGVDYTIASGTYRCCILTSDFSAGSYVKTSTSPISAICFCSLFASYSYCQVSANYVRCQCTSNSVCLCVYDICQVLCYYEYSGSAQTCIYERLYSTKDCVGSQKISVDNAELNWLAVAYG